jgi:hypothetical protein
MIRRVGRSGVVGCRVSFMKPWKGARTMQAEVLRLDAAGLGPASRIGPTDLESSASSLIVVSAAGRRNRQAPPD